MTVQPLAPVIPSSGVSAARQRARSAAGRPLQIGAIRLGVLLAQEDAAGPLAGTALVGLLAFTAAATGPLLAARRRRPGRSRSPTSRPPTR
jgi:hypothetical protein